MPDQAAGLLSPLLRARRTAAARPFLKGRVLDVGCGTGALAARVAPDRYDGADTDAESLRLARRAHPKHRFHAIGPDGALPAGQFDTVVALATVEHVPDVPAFLARLRDRLAPKGRILLTTPSPSLGWAHRLGAKLGIFSREAAAEHHELLDDEALARHAAAAGLRVERADQFLAGANQLFILVRAGDPPAPPPAGLEAWLQRHLTAVGLAVIASALILRIAAALGTYLDPDELYHVMVAGNTTAGDVFRRLIQYQIPHPPLYYLVVYLLNLVTSSEFVFRLPSIIAGTALLWVAWRWLRLIIDETAAFAGLLLCAFAPELVALSAQVREYALALLLLAAALYWLELALRDRRAGLMLLSGALLLLAQAALFSMMWVAVALGVYGLWRLIAERPGARLAAAWAGVQLALVATLGAFYRFHISQLLGVKRTSAADGWLHISYFHANVDSLVAFKLKQTAAVFQYLFSARVVGIILLALFCAALIVVALFRSRRQPRGRLLLFALPFGATLAAAFLRVYPYGGTRHSLHLALFAVAGVAVALAIVARRRLWPLLAAALILVPVWQFWFTPPSQHISRANQRRTLMTGLVERLRAIAPAGTPVFTDFQTQMMLRWYLCGSRRLDNDVRRGDFRECVGNGARLIYPDQHFVYWACDHRSFGPTFSHFVREYSLPPGTPVVVAHGGWGWNLGPSLPWDLNLAYPGRTDFGENLSAFIVPTGSEPGAPAARAALIELTRRLPKLPVSAVIWPTDQLRDSAGPPLPDLGVTALAYRDIFRDRGLLAAHLPALGLWQTGTFERHAEAFRYMNEAEPYVAGGLSFTLVAVAPDTAAIAYVIDVAR